MVESQHYFAREAIYGYSDDGERFVFFCRAVQGLFDQKVLAMTGLGGGFLRPQISERSDQFDLMSQGILYAYVINTVSPTYAREILTPEYSEGLDLVRKYRKARNFGILNGLDTQTFNPATYEELQANYDIKTLERKVENKLALQREGDLQEDPSIPLVGIVSRLADQKRFDLPDAQPL